MVYGKTPYVVWYVLTILYGKNTAVYGMVRLRYGTMVRCRRCLIWLNFAWWYGMFKYKRSVVDVFYG